MRKDSIILELIPTLQVKELEIRVRAMVLLGVSVSVSTLAPMFAQARDMRIEELERKLQERNKVIIELLERVEALERRIGVEHVPSLPDKTSPRAADQLLTGPNTENEPVEMSQSMPGVFVVREEEAERALERALTSEGALLLPPGFLEIEPGFTYVRKEDSAPSLVSSNDRLFAAKTQLNLDSYTADLALRLGLPLDSQLEVALPYRWRRMESVNSINFAPTNVSSVSGKGLGDVRVSFAKTLQRESLWRPDLVGRITWDSDSGELMDDGVSLGSGYNELSGSLTFIKRQDPLAFVGGFSYEYSFERRRFQSGPAVSLNFGSFIALSPETSLHFLFLGAYRNENEYDGEKILGSDRAPVSLEIGGTTLLARGVLLNLSVAMGLTDDANDFAISMSLPVRFNDRIY